MTVIRKGFTLIELLVVIAIIALLVTILAPSLARAKEITRQKICQSNEHQIMVAAMSYGPANHGSLPTGFRNIPDNRSWDQLLLNYGATLNVIRCPSRSDLTLDGTRHYWTNSNFDNAAWSNTVNSTGVMSNNWSANTSNIEVPDRTAAYTEMRLRVAGYADGGGPSVPGSGWGFGLWAWDDLFILRYIHMNRENIPFCDGHVDAFTWKELLGNPDSNGSYTLASPFYLFRRVKKGQ